MTAAEQKSLDQMRDMLRDSRIANDEFRKQITELTTALNKKVDEKHIPITLEGDIVQVAQNAVQQSIIKAFSDYNNPLQKYVFNVIGKYQKDFEEVFESVLKEALDSGRFRDSMREAFMHRVARSFVASMEGSVNKALTSLKQDALFKSKLTLSIDKLIEEFLANDKKSDS